ncbi:MAG: bacterioferritin [Bacteriovoracaceae bacterium]|nr:bacterioferritin [Bacteriovoracaceae bacterium]
MKGDAKIIDLLNGVLTRELTAINQYFLHSRILQDWGLDKIGALEYNASIDEMKHADQLIKRILFLEGIPNVQKLDKVTIGSNIEEIIAADLAVENAAVPYLKDCIAYAESVKDFVTRDLFSSILESEEEHVDWLETQQGLLEKVGVERYMQTQIVMES